MNTSANTSSSSLPPAGEAKRPTLTERYRVLVSGRTRIAAAWIAALSLAFFSKELPSLPGILVCFLGATLRSWASGYLRKDTRPAVGGPYGWIRNPLYLGTYLMAVGALLAIQAWVPLAVVSIIFAAIYHFIIFDEEEKLKRIFGEPYFLYLNSVPRFFPRPWKPSKAVLLQINPEQSHLRYDWALSQKNKWYEAYATFAALMAWVSLAAWSWSRWGS